MRTTRRTRSNVTVTVSVATVDEHCPEPDYRALVRDEVARATAPLVARISELETRVARLQRRMRTARTFRYPFMWIGLVLGGLLGAIVSTTFVTKARWASLVGTTHDGHTVYNSIASLTGWQWLVIGIITIAGAMLGGAIMAFVYRVPVIDDEIVEAETAEREEVTA